MSTENRAEALPSPFANRNFTYLYLGQLVSQFGDWFKTVVMLGVLYSLHPHPAAIGGLFICSVVPVFLGSAFCGPLVDRWNKKHLMIWTDLLRFLCALGVIWGIEQANLWVIFAFLCFSSLFSSLFVPARSALIPEILQEKNLIAATSSFAVLTSVTMVVASALGGFLADLVGTQFILYFDAFSYLVSALFILLIRYQPQKKEASTARVPYVRQIKEGIEFVKSRPQLVSVYWLVFWRDFCLGFVYILFSIFVLDTMDAGNTGMGIGYAVTAVAYLIGASWIKRSFKKKPFDDSAFFKIYFPFNMLYGIGLGAMFSMTDWYVFLVVLLLTNIFQSGVNVISETSLMTHAQPEVRGRVFASWLAMSRLAYGISLPLFSWLGAFIPTSFGGYLLAAILLISSFVLSLWLRTRLQGIQNLQEESTGVSS
jgi:DHA3 family macrolide efflux protein-like MFS transporter